VLVGSSLLSLALACAEAPEPIDKTPYPFVTDSQGRALILRGINVMSSAKHDPLRMPAIDRGDVQRMVQDWGFNHVRFLIFWDALEPEPDRFDHAYLDRVQERLDWFADAGIQVILDMHQDVYAARFCCDGAPEWAIRDDGQPFERQSQWFLNYFQPAVLAAFDNFWDVDGPHADLQEHYGRAWTEVARRFESHPAVIGYDLMNEPSAGSMTDTGELVCFPDPNSTSPIFDRTSLTPFYQRLIDQIRAVDADHWIFFEPRYGAPANGRPSWHGPLVDPRPGPPRIAYYPHLYSIALEASVRFDPEENETIANWERERREEADAQQQPLLIGEWGLTRQTENWQLFMERVLAMADRQLAGWAYWSYDPGDWGIIEGEDRTETASANVLVRTYAQRVAGTPTAMAFDPETKAFHLEFEERAGVTGATEIYVPRARHYPRGVRVTLDGAEVDAARGWDARREVLSIETATAAASHRIVIEAR